MEPAGESVGRSRLRELLSRLEVGRAVFFAVLLRFWQLVGGAVTLVLMTVFFTKQLQGFYYLFASLIGLQAFFELGFNIVVINLCSHEWAGLQLGPDGRIVGKSESISRLISLGRLLFRWYGIASLLFVVSVSIAGTLFLNSKPATAVNWQAPWLTLVLLSGLLLWSLPFNAILEGCNQVVAINRFRLIQAILASCSVWIVMVAGGGLWSAVAATATRLACEWGLLMIAYRRFYAPFLRPPTGPKIEWRSEIWPLQWRLAIGGIFAYFAFYLFAPVMWYYHDEILAGQMGMTWTVVVAIQAAALAWVQTRAPQFGILVRQQRRSELDQIFLRVTGLSFVAFALASITFWILIVWLDSAGFKVAERLLDPSATGLLLIAAFVQLVASSLTFYVRAHKQEPFVWVSVVSNSAIGLAVWLLGAHFGALGAAVGLLAVQLFINLPPIFFIWQNCRRSHATAG